MIIRNKYKGDLKLGSRLKETTVASLDAVTETTQAVADTVTTLRSAVELVHGSLQPAIMEQRIELAKTAQQGIKDLTDAGMNEKDVCEYLQIPYQPPVSKSVIVNAGANA